MEVQDGERIADCMVGKAPAVAPVAVRTGPFDVEAGLATLASLVVSHAKARRGAYRDRTGQELLECAFAACDQTLAGKLSTELDRIRERGIGSLAHVGKLQEELADIAAQQAADILMLLGWINKLEGDLQTLEVERDVAEERAS